MAELEKRYYAKRLQGTPQEDLDIMIAANCAGVPGFVPYESLVQVCAHGLTYGAMRTVCPDCKTILHKDGTSYSCFGKSRLVGSCSYSRRHVNTSSLPWEIPDSVTRQDLKTLKRKSMNHPVKSFLSPDEKRQRKELLSAISAHKYYHKTVLDKHGNNAKVLIRNGIHYIYFVIKSDDLAGSISHSFGILYKKGDKYFFYKYEKIYKKPAWHTYRRLLRNKIIEIFENQFYTITGGGSWNSWIEGTIKRDTDHFWPLKIDYYSKLDYLTAERIDEFHEQLVIKLKYLKKLRITEKEITEVSMQKAQDITLKDVYEAQLVDENQPLPKEIMAILKARLTILHEKREDREFYSILSRLLTSPVGTTTRLYDLPTKIEFFQPVKKILSVFFDYMKLKEQQTGRVLDDQYKDWPSSARDLTQEYMLKKTRGFIGAWIMNLVFASDKTAHHHHLTHKHSGGCSWSVLLRKSRKAFDNSSSNFFIICTIDTEQLPEGSNYDDVQERMDEQKDLEEIFLYRVREGDYNKYGYILHDDNRAKVTMIFHIKYENEKGTELSDVEKKKWIEFLSGFYSHFPREEWQSQLGSIVDKQIPFIYLGETDEKSLKDYLCYLRSTEVRFFGRVYRRKRRLGLQVVKVRQI